MTRNPANSASTPADVKIRTSTGAIGVTSTALFSCNDDATLHTLIDRVFQSSAVEAVLIDRDRSTVEIRYDREALDARSALQTFSDALGSTVTAVENGSVRAASLLRPCLEQIPGRVKRIERRRGTDPGLAIAALPKLAAEDKLLALLPSPDSAETAIDFDAVLVEFEPSQQGSPVGDVGGGPATGTSRLPLRDVVIQGGRRVLYTAAAGGCFVMSIVGVVTPGIPTVPFVLATGYFLARSSPTLHERFKRSAFFGQMVRDYEEHGGLRWFTKLKMILLTAGLILVTVIVTGGSLPFLVVAVGMGGLGIYMLNRIPTITGSPESAELEPATT